MSPTEQDPNAAKHQEPGASASGSATEPGAAAPTRRRHRRSTSTRGAQHAETVEPAAEATSPSAGGPAEQTPLVAEPATRTDSQETTRAEARAKTPTRRGGRRNGRARAPQLVTPPQAEQAESELPGAEPPAKASKEEPAGRTVPVFSEAAPTAALAAMEAPEATSEPSYEAVIETLTPADVTQALESAATETPTPAPRRYRFDQRGRATPAPARRPERLSAPAITVPATAASEAPAPRQNGQHEEVPSSEAADAAAPTDWSALATLGETIGETAMTPETEAPTPNGAADAEAVAATPSIPSEDAEGEEADSDAGARKRRRRRRSTGAGVRHLEAVVGPEQLEAEPTPLAPRLGERNGEPEPYPLYGGTHVASDERGRTETNGGPDQPYRMYAPYQQEPWNIASAHQQMGQPRSPFGAPEPNMARGFGPQPHGVAGPAPERTGRGARGERATDAPPMSANQLGAVLTQAIQQQTDRLLTELRHTQAPPSMTVMFPPLPSTERVGVFVDVANLLYSSRSMRVALDFGRLLEFLRGNRRLVRAHAYAPTSPEPHAEQQFLSVVKGVGYRITTKNYKTFSSGAKKADLDLDMCMDIVRLVDAKAVDTVVLVSGDSDFLPLLEYCSDHGVRVEVAAFDDATAAILRQSCDLFVNLSLVDDIRG